MDLLEQFNATLSREEQGADQYIDIPGSGNLKGLIWTITFNHNTTDLPPQKYGKFATFHHIRIDKQNTSKITHKNSRDNRPTPLELK